MLGWPGCCRKKKDPCADVCVTATGDEDDEVISGATVDGGALGTCTTDSGGRCCLPVAAPGTYPFTISKPGYATQSFDVEVTEEECDAAAPVTKEVEVTLPETVPGGGLVTGCTNPATGLPHPIGGVTIVVTDALGNVVAAVVSDANGYAPYTVPEAGNYTLTGNLAPWLETVDTVFHAAAGTYQAALQMAYDEADWMCCRGDTPISRTLHISDPLGSFTFAKAAAGNAGSWSICHVFDYYGDGSPAAIAYGFQCWTEAGVVGYMVTISFCAGRVDPSSPWVGDPGSGCNTLGDGSTTLVNCHEGANSTAARHRIFVPRTPSTMAPVAVSVTFPATTSQNFIDGAFRTLAIPLPGAVTITE